MTSASSLRSFSVSSFTFETCSQYPGIAIKTATKCYTPASQYEGNDMPAASLDYSGYILILVLGADFPNELWEPVISRLFDIQSDMQYASIATGVPLPTPVKEIWVLDHNEKTIEVLDCANVIAAFRRDFLGGSLKEKSYTETDKFVLVAHSVGCLEAILSTPLGSSLKSIFHSLIISEPILSQLQSDKIKTFTESASAYVSHQKAERAYQRNISGSKPALLHLNKICSVIPVHAIFGSVDDILSRGDKESLVDPSEGRTIASVSKVEGIGHWIPQSSPQKMAEAVFNILQRFGGLQSIRGNIDPLLTKL